MKAIPTIDAHHHIWRLKDLTWLSGPQVPRIFGPYEAIRRDYPIEEFRADTSGCDIVKSVYVQTNWPAGQRLRRSRSGCSRSATRPGWPHANVAYADLADPGLRGALIERLAQLQGDARDSPADPLAPKPAIPLRATPRSHKRSRSWRGWPEASRGAQSAVRDPGCSPVRMGPVARALRACLSRYDVRAGARRHAGRHDRGRLEVVAGRHAGAGGRAEHERQAVGTWNLRSRLPCRRDGTDHSSETVDMFGAGRCIYGNNFPIEKLWTDYRTFYRTFRELRSIDLSARPTSARSCTTPRRGFYRFDLRL